MTLETARSFLLWCFVLNYATLLVWFSAFRFGHDWMYQLHGRWYRLSHEQFDGIHYLLMGVFKLGVILFNVVPFIALHIME
ncbi:MAG: DUF6868 family protein [Planctomycetaceae bacterium]